MLIKILYDNTNEKDIYIEKYFKENKNNTTASLDTLEYHPQYVVKKLLRLFKINKTTIHYKKIFDKLGIEKIENKKLEELSKEELERLKLFITLLEPKNNIIFDEPTTLLDKANRTAFYELINDLKSKYNIVVLTQDYDELDTICDNIYKLNEMENTTLFK